MFFCIVSILQMQTTVFFVLFVSLVVPAASVEKQIIENPDKGTLSVCDGQKIILTYRYKDQLPEGVPTRQKRSCYIHPIYSLDGKVLTDDFPVDHRHHHGLFWTWPVVRTRGQDTQTWHPTESLLRQHFARWLERTVKDRLVILRVENDWKLNEKDVVAKEEVTICIYPADEVSREIDVELRFQAVGGPLELSGAPDQNKGYGGLCLRGAPLFKGAVLTTDQGVQTKDATNVPFRWADMSTDKLGVAIFVASDHPDFPITWLIRNSYAGILNPSWPGLDTVVLRPEKPVVLRYRLYVHRGDAVSGHVAEAYERFIRKSSVGHDNILTKR